MHNGTWVELLVYAYPEKDLSISISEEWHLLEKLLLSFGHNFLYIVMTTQGNPLR